MLLVFSLEWKTPGALDHRVEGRRVASLRMYVSAQPSPNRTGNFSLHPALQHSTLSRNPEISSVARTSNTRSTTSVCVVALDGYVSGPSPVCTAFPCSLGGRSSTDYYGQSAPPVPLRPKHVSLSRARTGGSSVAVWLLDGRRDDFRMRSRRPRA